MDGFLSRVIESFNELRIEDTNLRVYNEIVTKLALNLEASRGYNLGEFGEGVVDLVDGVISSLREIGQSTRKLNNAARSGTYVGVCVILSNFVISVDEEDCILSLVAESLDHDMGPKINLNASLVDGEFEGEIHGI